MLKILDDQSFLLIKSNNKDSQSSKFKIINFLIVRPLKYIFRVQTPEQFIPIFIDFASVLVILMDLFLIPLSLSFKEIQTI